MKQLEIQILQIEDMNNDLIFRPLPFDIDELNLDKEGYEIVYKYILEIDDIVDISVDYILERVYYKFNAEHPEDYKGRSLSVSDIVVINNDQHYYCNSFGWKKIKCY